MITHTHSHALTRTYTHYSGLLRYSTAECCDDYRERESVCVCVCVLGREKAEKIKLNSFILLMAPASFQTQVRKDKTKGGGRERIVLLEKKHSL